MKKSPALRIIDANLNRAREALRVLEEHARFVLNDSGLAERIKTSRHSLVQIACGYDSRALLESRDVPGDVGSRITTEAETRRHNSTEVAQAAAKRASEALRCIEEYGKIFDSVTAQMAESLRYDIYKIEQDLMLTGANRVRLRQARMHVLLTGDLCRKNWQLVCKQAILGGAEIIQLREKDISDQTLLARAHKLRTLTRRYNVLLIINDRADIARLVEADGVHVGQEDLTVREARQIAGPRMLIGKSTHSLEQARSALKEKPDYIAVGTMFASKTKPDVKIQGPALLKKVLRLCEIPVVAIGGIDAQNITKLSQDPRVQVAVSHSVIGVMEVKQMVQKILKHIPPREQAEDVVE